MHRSFVASLLGLFVLSPFTIAAPTLSLAFTDSLQHSELAQSGHLVVEDLNFPAVETSISRQNSEEFGFVGHQRSRTFQRMPKIMAERYPSPHGKNSHWRFDLRHTFSEMPNQVLLSRNVDSGFNKESPSEKFM